MLPYPSELLSFVFNPVFDIATDTRTSVPLLAFYLSIAWSVSLKNTLEMCNFVDGDCFVSLNK